MFHNKKWAALSNVAFSQAFYRITYRICIITIVLLWDLIEDAMLRATAAASSNLELGVFVICFGMLRVAVHAWRSFG